MRVEGVIECVGPTTSADRATLRVRVEDVSRADADSIVLAEEVRRDVSFPAARGELAFSFEVPIAATTGHYTVSAHVDVDGSGEVAAGDLVSTEHIAVDPTRSRQHLTVPVRQVGSS